MTPPIIELEKVRFGWQNDRPVIDIPSLRINLGERVFLKGPSGSGKSSLLNLIGGIQTPQEGRICVLGNVINHYGSGWRDRFRSDHIGYIFQQFNLLPYLSVIENVMLPCRFSKLRRVRAIERYGGLEDAAKQLLNHLGLVDDYLLTSEVTKLSIGQQQRVAAARALIGSPELVIADEPTSALDTDARNAFLNLLISECDQSDSTLIFVSHDHTLEQYFSRVVSLNDINSAEIFI
ncbi:ABC transporter ATP-binding protein [Amphritea sp.]|uniref:ABC transporter ATP-binding protein n=1 Tax=Amphritea sp. TaxID=1872502 RepID=UPI0025B9189F|nr:ABC transporter ATP-binding protein [Amphritea sp.]